ncbi:MAG: thioredoxin family protein [Candidatus Levybacteria bacterium]|nr:thioredoxin family protein [Candidatus Levybacteria bacterium]
MNKNTIWIVITGIIILALGTVLFYQNSLNSTKSSDSMMEKSPTVSEDKMMEDKDQKPLTKEGYAGQLLSGNTTPFLDFTKKDYEKAKSEEKVIFLDFYANWCPICRAEAPELNEGFNMLDNKNVVGFRVNFNDSDTDEAEKGLAKEFEVSYQHTKVILQNGNIVLKDMDTWDKAKLIEELSKF